QGINASGITWQAVQNGNVVTAASVASIAIFTTTNIAAAVTAMGTGTFTLRAVSAFDNTKWAEVVIAVHVGTPILDLSLFNISNNEIVSLTAAGRDRSAIMIPASVTSIGDEAFSGNTRIARVYFESGSLLANIGHSAFSGATNLRSIQIPDSVTTIGFAAFLNTRALTQIVLPSGLTRIEGGAFENSNLLSIVIPNTVTHIGNAAFRGNSNITSITLSNSLVSIGDNAFSGLRRVPSITIPASATYIGNLAFGGWRGDTQGGFAPQRIFVEGKTERPAGFHERWSGTEAAHHAYLLQWLG
ncbi:MAG: leucine-rich repeat domain-containing protein, partial [Firmicutes bacterium]|nr:leucine-rich repeat domain-containing protein [Bacillota bacterium]